MSQLTPLTRSQPSSAFSTILTLFHLFNLHAPLTLLFFDAPFGRFSWTQSKLNVPGNIAWSLMELVAPTTILTTLLNSHRNLSSPSRILTGLFLLHYTHRAIVSPLILSPPRSPLHIMIPVAAAIFNLFNGYLIGYGLAYYQPDISVWTLRFWVPVFGWAIGLAGNIYHDEILNDLRRPPGHKLLAISELGNTTSNGAKQEKQDGEEGRYHIPYGGLFKYVSFPNYLCEWFEWTCFAFSASPTLFISIPTPSFITATAAFLGLSSPLFLGQTMWLLAPAWAFVLAEITSMIPRAVRGHRWYHDRFGGRYPPDRKVVIPWFL